MKRNILTAALWLTTIILAAILLHARTSGQDQNNNELIIEIKKCEDAGLRAVMLNLPARIECRPQVEK